MNAFLEALGRASLVGLAALSVALTAQHFLDGRVPAAWRVWLWRAASASMLLALWPIQPLSLPVLPAKISVSTTSVSTRTEKRETTSSTKAASVLSSTPPRQRLAASRSDSREIESTKPAPARSAAPVADSPQPEVTPRDWLELGRIGISIVVVCGWLLALGRLASAARRVRQVLNACQNVDETRVLFAAREIGARMEIKCLPRLMKSASGAPFLVGVLRPTIVIPRAFVDESDAPLEAVLAHEMAHLERRDLAWSALLWLVQSVFWFHPLSWISRRFLILETESACDELVLQITRIAPKSYGALLLNTMKLENSPLTAGVGDGFHTFKTRLRRLNRAPARPNRGAKWAFAAALCVAFGAAIPFRLVARAQSAPPVSKPKIMSGTVRDEAGKPVAGATIYLMRSGRAEKPLATTRSDENGAWTFGEPLDRERLYGERFVELFVDAGARGFGRSTPYGGANSKAVSVQIKAPVRARLRFVDESNRGVGGLNVRLARVGTSQNSWFAFPLPFFNTLRTTTNARGEAIFPRLPAAPLAIFQLSDERWLPARYGLGDRRGGRFAALSTEDFVALSAPEVRQTIRLTAPVQLKGRVTLPEGAPAGNVLVLARRINALEAAGKPQARDQTIAQTRSDSKGNYVLDGLRPGRYYVWIYPEKRLTRHFIGPSTERNLNARINRVNFTLSRGALIQGVVLSQGTKQPVRGQTMGLFDSQENYQYAITDARGYFQFRVLGGKQHLWVHANGSNSPPPGFVLPAKSEFDFSIQNGEKRDFKIELPGEPFVKLTTGTVLGTNGNPVANATVSYRMMGARNDGKFHQITTDANGRFSIPKKWSARPVQLVAESGNATTPRSSIALSGDAMTLRLEDGAFASLRGTVRDGQKTPISGAKVQLFVVIGGVGTTTQNVTTGTDGKFQFERIRPGSGVFVEATKVGFSRSFETTYDLRKGETRTLDAVLMAARATLGGRVFKSDGTAAGGYQIWSPGSIKPSMTRADGRFYLSQVLEGPTHVFVTSPNHTDQWGPIKTRGNQKNMSIRLGKTNRSVRTMSSELENQSRKARQSALVGQSAPEIKAARWANGRAQSLRALRGKVVMLAFGGFNRGDSDLGDIASSLQARGVEVVSVRFSIGTAASLQRELDAAGKNLPFPVALDAPSSKRGEFGQTFALYASAAYVIIGRDGRIVFAGDKLDRALSFAATAAK